MYTAINWKDGTEEKTTPLSANNLHHMDQGILKNAQDIQTLSAKPTIYSGTAAPAASLGKVGDIYFRRI